VSSQAGLARRGQLRRLGIISNHVDEQVAAGRWRLVAPEVVSVDNGRLDAQQPRWRAVLHAPCSWLGGRSALAQVGLSGYPPAADHILVPRLRRPQPLDGVAIHVTGRLPPGPDGSPHDEIAEWLLESPSGTVRQELRRPAGPPTTTAARAAVDAAAWEPYPRAAAGLVLAVVQQQLVPATAILDELALAGRIRHRAVVRDALAHAIDGADSLAEVDILPLLRQAGLGLPRRQVRHAGRRRDLEVDLPGGQLLVIEIDGPQHDSPEARRADADRDAELAAEGILVLHISTYDIRHESLRVVARLRGFHDAARRRASLR
jgi:hypothetical protein